MSEHAEPAAEAPVEGDAPARGRLGRLFSWILGWALASRVMMIVGSVVGLVLLGAVFAAWSYFGQIALEPVDPASVELAIAALDAGKYDEAKLLVGQMQRQPAAPELLGGALYVLGAVKAHEAGEEVSPDRRRIMHEIAARYLQKAASLGLPGERQGRAAYLLGKSLAKSGQWEEAIPALEEALRDESQPATEIHSLLVESLREGPESNLSIALKHNELVLADPALPQAAREQAWITGAGTLLRLQRFKAAREILAQIPKDSHVAASAMLLRGRLEIEEAQTLDKESPERAAKLAAALVDLQEAARLDVEHGPLSRQALLWMARRFELMNDHAAAHGEYDRLGKVHVNTPEGLAAMLAAADYHRRGGQFDKALEGYRHVLREIGAQVAYDSTLMPLSDVRRRLTTVYQQCVDEGRFAEAQTLVDLFEPVFGRVSCAEMRAKTFRQWGESRLGQAHDGGRAEDVAARKEGRGHLRAAGRAFEELARLRAATRQFTDDLWAAADCYFTGQSFTNAARLFEEYLHHEAKRQNALALLRLGQARLAIGEYDMAIAVLEECVEMFPDDAIAHQARLECARSYQRRGKTDLAEQLLLINLVGGSLTPASPEWRDSLFALGGLLHESGRYEDAIEKLQEAVERYPDEKAALLARYTIARSYHEAAAAPAARLQESKTDQAARAAWNESLTKAHEHYQAVQRTITLRGQAGGDALDRALLRNCYLMQGSVLFELRRFEEALQAYGNVITSYQNDPIALESFVQVANCWRRLNQPVKARVTLDQAKMVLKELPAETDFQATTNFNRQQWELLLSQMSNW
jgi:tetratricopeptide (TPR) repeat protein